MMEGKSVNSIGVGLIGTGYMGKCHALAWNGVKPVFGDGPKVRLVHLAEVSAELAERKAGEFGFEKATGDFLGWFHLRPSPDHPVADEPELGYRLRRASWGQGYATEGSRALIDRAFAELGASRVFAETMAVNTASRRVMEKTGLRLVRTFHADWPVRIPGDEHGDVEYAITRDEWEADRRRSRTARGCVE